MSIVADVCKYMYVLTVVCKYVHVLLNLCRLSRMLCRTKMSSYRLVGANVYTWMCIHTYVCAGVGVTCSCLLPLHPM